MSESTSNRSESNRNRLLAAAWFGVFALVGSSLIYLFPAVAHQSPVPLLLFCILPSVPAAIAGAFIGSRILDKNIVKGAVSAAMHGVLV